jgi:deazaflavin-dependent oxidoreductase (nitroreductase family)
MKKEIQNALENDRLLDITTTGRKSGNPHRIEIMFDYFQGKIYLSGRPDLKKDWYANMLANPALTVHFKQSLQRDIPARATPITDQDVRRAVFTYALSKWEEKQDLDLWVKSGKLVEVQLEI